MKTSEMKVIELSGSPENRGHIYGESARDSIGVCMEQYGDDFSRTNDVNLDLFIDEFLENANFTPAINKWAPGILEEIKAIAKASNIDYKKLLTFNLGDETYWFAHYSKLGIKIDDGEHCSSIAAYNQDGPPTVAGQNMDIYSWTEGHQVLLKIKYENSPVEAYAFAFAGNLGLNGINNQGVGINCNSLMELNPCIDGLPVGFVIRAVMEKQSWQAAKDFIFNIKHASGQHYLLSGADEAVSLECSANKVVPFKPEKNIDRLYFANSPMANDDQSRWESAMKKEKQEGLEHTEFAKDRYASLKESMSDLNRPVDVEKAKSVLSVTDDGKHYPVCRKLDKDKKV